MTTLTPDERAAAFKTLLANGLTFGDCARAFSARTTDELAYVEGARQKARDGLLEVDSEAVVSESDDGGAYVSAWLWVDDRDCWAGPLDTDGNPCRSINHYTCDACNESWKDQWSCACNDHCPVCDAEIEPHDSVALDLGGNPIETG